uniref:DUF4777 domain-containing protein n=1 Tax=Heliothis virescens TaxID=7102 RepID=A0A2A4J9D2_HELVI
MEQIGPMETVVATPDHQVEFMPPRYPSGKLIIQFLQDMKTGATMSEIVQYLSSEYGKDAREMTASVLALLENGTALGFLERKGSQYMNWSARAAAGCKRRRRRQPRSCCCRRRKRKIRRRSCKKKRRRRC